MLDPEIHQLKFDEEYDPSIIGCKACDWKPEVPAVQAGVRRNYYSQWVDHLVTGEHYDKVSSRAGFIAAQLLKHPEFEVVVAVPEYWEGETTYEQVRSLKVEDGRIRLSHEV